jgi:hypothetical protein
MCRATVSSSNFLSPSSDSLRALSQDSSTQGATLPETRPTTCAERLSHQATSWPSKSPQQRLSQRLAQSFVTGQLDTGSNSSRDSPTDMCRATVSSSRSSKSPQQRLSQSFVAGQLNTGSSSHRDSPTDMCRATTSPSNFLTEKISQQ